MHLELLRDPKLEGIVRYKEINQTCFESEPLIPRNYFTSAQQPVKFQILRSCSSSALMHLFLMTVNHEYAYVRGTFL